MKTKLVLRHKWALGDTVLLTGLVRDIHKAYPGEYEIKVDTHFTNVWWNNPYISDFDTGNSRATNVDISWGDAIKQNGYAKEKDRKVMKHILAWYHHDFKNKTGIEVPVTDPKPDLHLTPQEQQRIIQGRYWIVVAGGKLDLTTKHWHAHRMQEVVDRLGKYGIHCVQIGAVHTNHIHPPLNGVTNMVGKTENARDMFNLVKHSEGVICGVTGAMHIAAAYDKPCVVYAGGREEPWFEAYVDNFNAFGPGANPVKVPHKFLHTIGLLDCCDVQGCWKKRTVPLDPADLSKKAYTLCRQPVRAKDTHPVAKCQDLITVDHIVEAVMEYYDEKVLPPISIQKEEKIEIPKVELVEVKAGDIVRKGKIEVVRKPSLDIKAQKPYQKVHPQEITKASVGTIQRKLPELDHSIIGGKITACVLCYGPYPELARKSITSLLETIPPERLDLRVATNQVPQATIDFLRTLPITKLYLNSENRYKYPVMREMLHDKQAPIQTKYMVWFDDDTWIVKPQWIKDLAETIINFHPYNFRMFGNLLYHDLNIYSKNSVSPLKWFKEARWWRDRPLRARGGHAEVPNGSVIDFAVGWCWALSTELIKLADIPDVRLQHNGGDITIGEQVHQAGYLIKQWNKGKSLVACPTREQGGRRGYSEKFPWDQS